MIKIVNVFYELIINLRRKKTPCTGTSLIGENKNAF